MNRFLSIFIFSLFLIFFSFYRVEVSAQEKYLVYFTDKADVHFNPYEFFHPKAIERRVKTGVSLYDYSDWPVNESYLAQVKALVDSSGIHSRWLNALVVFANEKQLYDLQRLSFVSSAERLGNLKLMMSEEVAEDDFGAQMQAVEAGVRSGFSIGNRHEPDMPLQFKISTSNDLMRDQLMSMQGDLFVKKNLTGRGVRIAVFDVGFKEVDKHPAFEHIRGNGKILMTKDFVQGDDHVYAHGSHGRSVLSNIAGVYKHEMLGLAPEAEFLLVRTEKAITEPFSEEENWLAAAEWADQQGADIISSSLGYVHHRYFITEMDGKTSLVSRAATMAARKGILVVNSMGNEGQSEWKTLGAPADADSILSIGGINPKTGLHTSFSSFGPTADRRRKPNLAAYGHTIVASPTALTETQGTSFSTPLISGFAACVMQLHPEWTNMQVLEAMEASGSLYPYYDYAHGYGIPQAGYFILDQDPAEGAEFEIIDSPECIRIVVNQFDKEKKEYLYYHIQRSGKNYLETYKVVLVDQSPAEVKIYDLQQGDTIRAHYRSATKSFRKEK